MDISEPGGAALYERRTRPDEQFVFTVVLADALKPRASGYDATADFGTVRRPLES